MGKDGVALTDPTLLCIQNDLSLTVLGLSYVVYCCEIPTILFIIWLGQRRSGPQSRRNVRDFKGERRGPWKTCEEVPWLGIFS
jgi:hypothetical protein